MAEPTKDPDGSVIDLFKTVARSISDRVSVFYGVLSDFEAKQDKEYPYIIIDPLAPTVLNNGAGIEYPIGLSVVDKDDPSGNEEETSEVWNRMQHLANQFYWKLERFSENPDLDLTQDIVLSDAQCTKIRKAPGSDVVSGVVVRFTMTVPNNFDYCDLYE